MRILNVGSGNDLTIGTDFIDLYPKDPRELRCDVDTDRFPYPDETFDEVYSRCVFEHITNIRNMVSECYRVLKKRGKVTIITDNATYVGWWKNLHYYKSGGEEDLHYGLFTHAHFRNWAKKFGFEIKSLSYETFREKGLPWYKVIIKHYLIPLLPKRLGQPRIRVEMVKL